MVSSKFGLYLVYFKIIIATFIEILLCTGFVKKASITSQIGNDKIVTVIF